MRISDWSSDVGSADLWRAQLAQPPEATLADLKLARAQGSGGDFRPAIARLSLLTASHSGDPRAWFELGKFSILQGEARRAVDDYLVRSLEIGRASCRERVCQYV